MNAFSILSALSGIRPAFVVEAGDMLGYLDSGVQDHRIRRRRLSTILIAAALALLLAACGYAVYRATMRHRIPRPTDAMHYYIAGLRQSDSGETGQRHLELNHGTCALALQFDTEEWGTAHGFRLKPGAAINPDWEPAGSGFDRFLRSFAASDIPQPWHEDSIRATEEQVFRDAGVSAEEAAKWCKNLEFFHGDGPDRLQMLINIYDGPWLHNLDLICGWPKGEATIVHDGTLREYQLLSALIDVDRGEYHELVNEVFLFHPQEQYLLALAARADSAAIEEMEQLAGNIEVLNTTLRYREGERGTNWSLFSLANG